MPSNGTILTFSQGNIPKFNSPFVQILEQKCSDVQVILPEKIYR